MQLMTSGPHLPAASPHWHDPNWLDDREKWTGEERKGLRCDVQPPCMTGEVAGCGRRQGRADIKVHAVRDGEVHIRLLLRLPGLFQHRGLRLRSSRRQRRGCCRRRQRRQAGAPSLGAALLRPTVGAVPARVAGAAEAQQSVPGRALQDRFVLLGCGSVALRWMSAVLADLHAPAPMWGQMRSKARPSNLQHSSRSVVVWSGKQSSADVTRLLRWPV